MKDQAGHRALPILASSARAVAGSIALAAWIGLFMHWSIDTARMNGSLFGGLWFQLAHLTDLSALLAALTMAAIAIRGSSPTLDHMTAIATLSEVLVLILYWSMLYGTRSLGSAELSASLVLHALVPVALVGWAMSVRPINRFSSIVALSWTAYPVAYFLYAEVRGWVSGEYAYRFIDPVQLGVWRVARNAVLIGIAYFVLAWAYAAYWNSRMPTDDSVSKP